MKACVKVITPAAGIGPQTFTGFVDSSGVPFPPKVLIPIGVAPLNSASSYWSWALGFDDGTKHWGEASDEGPAVGLKDGAAGTSGDYSVLKFHDTLSFGGEFLTLAYITAIRSGEIDIQFDLNNSPGHSYIVIALGGDDLQYSLLFTSTAGTYTPGFETVALINKFQGTTSGSATGGGTLAHGLGIATKSDGNQASIASIACGGDFSSGDNARYQGIDNLFSILAGTFLGPTNTFGRSAKTLSAWGGTTFGLAGSSTSTASLALGGIRATSGTWQEPATDGSIDIDTTINRKIVIFLSSGQTGFGTLSNGTAEALIGVYDGTNNVSFWTGEDYVGDTGASLKGARSVSSSQAIQFASPNGGSTSFANKATAALLESTKVRLAFTNTDGTQRSGIWLALGEDVVVVPPPVGGIPTEGCTLGAVSPVSNIITSRFLLE